jgi:hypothetical protein
MYTVYWTVIQNEQRQPFLEIFDSHEMVKALAFMENLRRSQRDNGDVSFITFASEHPDNKTKLGVDVVGPDYDWKKRRI